MKFPQEFLDEVKKKNDLLDVASFYYPDIKPLSDNQYQANCKHGDTNASLTFYADTQTFYCFGCGAGDRDNSYGSDVIGFIQWMEEITFHQAVKHLAERAKIPMPTDNSPFAKEKQYVLKTNRQYWGNLKGCPDAVKYFADRGVNEELIAKWRLGCTSGNPIMVTFGIMDTYGDTVGFGYRYLYEKDRGPQDPKYKNSKASDLFNKRKILYGLNYAIPLIRKKKYAVLVEGFFDAIALQNVGVPAVADMGTSLTEEQIELLKDYTNNVILFFDGDGPGVKATIKTIDLLEAKKMSVKIVNVHGKDPDDIAEQYQEGTEDFLMGNALKISQYKMNLAIGRYNATIGEAASNLISETIGILMNTKNPVDKLAYISEINRVLQGDYTYLLEELLKGDE